MKFLDLTPTLALMAAATLLLAPAAGTAAPAPIDPQDDRALAALAGLDYLRSVQDPAGCINDKPAASAWSALAFAQAGVDPQDVAVPGGASLEACVVAWTTPTLSTLSMERQVLALAASGADPRSAAGFDAVQAILDTFDGEQLGSPDWLNDDIFGLLALHAAGVPASDPVVQQVRAFVEQNQLPTGAFPFATWSPPGADAANGVLFADSDLTSAAIVALTATGSASDDAPVLRALAYLKANQVVLDGGHTWSPVGTAFDALFAPEQLLTSNADSTSWAMMGLSAAGHSPEDPLWTSPVTGANAVSFLLEVQQPDGHFQYRPGQESFFGPESTTAYAVLALLGGTFVA